CNKLKMYNNTPTDTQIIFHILDGLPDTQEWEMWTMVTEGDLKALAASDRLDGLRKILSTFEVKLLMKQSITLAEALFSKTKTQKVSKKLYNPTSISNS